MVSDAPLRWDAHGVPHSIVFNDKYFCTENGLEESQFVSCQGNRLHERFSALNAGETFTIIETGFGTGLSFCCAWQLWREHAPQHCTLHFISVELYPLEGAHIAKALERWPQLEPFTHELLKHYQPSMGGVKTFHLDEGRLVLTIVFQEVVEALEHIHQQGICPQGADAWFLNGFSPFANPLMWRNEVFKAMVPLSHAGTTLSTFTVAGFVRRGLEFYGFKVQRVPGFGKKKTILIGEF